MADHVLRHGNVAIVVEEGAVLAAVDQLANGVGTSFLRRSLLVFEAIHADVQARWPVDTGKSKAAFRLVSSIRTTEIAVGIENPWRSAGKRPITADRVVWSRFSEAARRQILTGASTAALSAQDQAKVARGSTPEAAAKVESYLRASNTRKAARRVAGFGQVPPVGLEGRQPWAVLVRQPAEREAPGVVEGLQADLLRLARGER